MSIEFLASVITTMFLAKKNEEACGGAFLSFYLIHSNHLGKKKQKHAILSLHLLILKPLYFILHDSRLSMCG